VEDRVDLKPELTNYVDADGGTNPHRKSISGYVFTITGVLWSRLGVDHGVSSANRVTWPTQKVICCQQTCGFFVVNLIIKHALPTATTHLYILNYAIFLYIETHMMAINGHQSTAKYG
jgi:hypothetical protein